MIWIALVGLNFINGFNLPFFVTKYCSNSLRVLVRKSPNPVIRCNQPCARFEHGHSMTLYYLMVNKVDEWFIDNDIQYELKWHDIGDDHVLKIGMSEEVVTLFLLTWAGVNDDTD
jgi:hypothetical protein